MAFAMLPIVAAVTQQGWSFMMFSIMLSGAVLWRHKDNSRRLWAGTEPKMGRRPIGDPVGER
jgi:glycerol-3-phosphate acyltransferase PlsY